jgi:hypothetical protein
LPFLVLQLPREQRGKWGVHGRPKEVLLPAETKEEEPDPLAYLLCCYLSSLFGETSGIEKESAPSIAQIL